MQKYKCRNNAHASYLIYRSDLDKKLGHDLKNAYRIFKKEETSSSPAHIIINHYFIEIHKVPHII